MAAPLSPNRIHTLPVQVNYHIPSSSQTFTTLFSTPQQVYVHPGAGGSASVERDEAWGSIYLKTVVEGLLWASPELHPSHSNTPDLSLYILDPRETSLKRSRPPPIGSSPSLGTAQEVWTGKGLISWALAEPGVGKNLITGRLIRSRDFPSLAPADGNRGDISPLEALMTCQEEECWGIEISIGLKNGLNSPVHIETVQAKREVTTQQQLSKPTASSSSSASSASSPPARIPTQKRSAEKHKTTTTTKKRKTDRTKLTAIDANIPAINNRPNLGKVLPGDLYAKPDTLTKDQAQRLLASPAFLDMIQKLTSKNEVTQVTDPVEDGVLCCYNCGRTKSAVWRTKEMADGQSRRLCNACGLYWNKAKVMRPPTMWEGVDEEIPRKGGKSASTPGPASEPDRPLSSRASRVDSASSSFKRTLSIVVDKDAQRIASLRHRPQVRSKLAGKAVAMTSPLRASTSASRGINHAGVSSPGWAPTPVNIATKFTKASGRSQSTSISLPGPSNPKPQSLDLPLSDDAPKTDNNWENDLSSFFNIEGFNLPALTSDDLASSHQLYRTQSAQPPTSTTSDQDEVLSQLFHRTSSVNMTSSPPFDFSQLPPSSPPIMQTPDLDLDLPHSALLLSSPGFSPDFSPLHTDSLTPTMTTYHYDTQRKETEKSSLSRQVLADQQQQSVSRMKDVNGAPAQVSGGILDQMGHNGNPNGYDAAGAYQALQELLRSMDNGGQDQGQSHAHFESSAAVAEGLCGDDDLFALLNESFADGFP